MRFQWWSLKHNQAVEARTGRTAQRQSQETESVEKGQLLSSAATIQFKSGHKTSSLSSPCLAKHGYHDKPSISSNALSSHNNTIAPKTDPATAAKTVKLPRFDMNDAPTGLAAFPLSPPVVANACTPNVVPLTTCVVPPVVIVVVISAGAGVFVVLEHPLHTPVQLLAGPQPAVQVVQSPQLTPLAFVPHGPPPGPQPPAPPPPKPPGPPQPECPDHGPAPLLHPLGADGNAPLHALTQLDQLPLFHPPAGPHPLGPAVI